MHEVITNLLLLGALLLKVSVGTGAVVSMPAICWYEWRQRRHSHIREFVKKPCVGERAYRGKAA